MLHLSDALDAGLAKWRQQGAPPEIVFDQDHARVMHRIDLHGMGPFLAVTTDASKLPQSVMQSLRQRLLAREIWEENHKRVLVSALDALTEVGLTPIIMKGTALAYSHYPRPSARVRGDSDILIEEDGRTLAFQALEKAGFHRVLDAGGPTVTAEALFQKADLRGQLHDIDLHWRLNSSPVLAKLFSHAELLARSEPLEALHLAARRPGDVDALLFASVHRRLHIDRPTHIYLNGIAHPVIDSLTWLTDIDLLFAAMTAEERSKLVERAVSKEVPDILSDSLRHGATRLGTRVAPDIFERLKTRKPGQVARYIQAAPLQGLFMNLLAIRSMGGRRRFLRELLLPQEDYMRTHFSRGRFDWLCVLHARRLLPGIVKHLRKRQRKS